MVRWKTLPCLDWSVFCLFHLYLLLGRWKVRGEKKKQKQKTFKTYSDGKESSPNARHLGLIPGLGRFPGKENGYPLRYSWLEHPMDRGVWWATVHGVMKSWTWLSNFHFSHFFGLVKNRRKEKKTKKQKRQKICNTCRQERSASSWIME